MSLLDFPPLNSSGKPYALQEFNGRLLSGNLAEFQAMAKCKSMSDYPYIERTQLDALQHSISKNDITGAFVFREADQLSQALDRWKRDGLLGVIDYVADITEDSKLWPVSRFSRGVVRIQDGLARMASRIVPSLDQDRIDEILQQYGSTINCNWLRCVAVHDEGRRLAICQNNDYIRVYNIGQPQRTPLTLKHPLQKNVTCMDWEPFDQRVLAVAASERILIWRLNTKGANIKPSLQCAQVIELSIAPISQIIWDRTTTNAILATSPNSGKIMIVDVSTGEVDSFGAWTGGNITNVVPTADGRRLAILYTGNIIRVYDRNTWREERWTGLAGRAVSAVWSSTGSYLLFSTENSHQLYSIAFTAKNEINEEGIVETRSIGDTHAIPVFDLSAVEFDPSEVEIEGAVEREIVTIGGKVQCITLSRDGQRLAISFADNPNVVTLFIVDWLPVFRITPIGFVEAPTLGYASMIFFLPKFSGGSMLSVVWSDGCIQYLPLIYGPKSSLNFSSRIIFR
ncbi:hypothetical protein KIN20_011567 [Parelaphostrongylus tenuis]|uniref:Aladin seven-bladed propeller domain-containing protein n=1 Tax=Parelaphostrongylus tenuis TaxID=148309 RepID=A0AAD5QJS5_PARTN|nr:hypothetical protein KIN20_011567 [Parelaphostrongylus tenuis]